MIRTCDPLVRSQILYPAELRARVGRKRLFHFTQPDAVFASAVICQNSNDPMTERLYYTDSYLRDFTARIAGHADDGRTVYLDRTAFYPTSGGQPFDIGSIAGVAVLEVVDEGGRIAHLLAAPLNAPLNEIPVECAIDWNRR